MIVRFTCYISSVYGSDSKEFCLFRKKPRIDWNISWWWLFCTYFASENNHFPMHKLNAFGKIFIIFSIMVGELVDWGVGHSFWTITKFVHCWQLVFYISIVEDNSNARENTKQHGELEHVHSNYQMPIGIFQILKTCHLTISQLILGNLLVHFTGICMGIELRKYWMCFCRNIQNCMLHFFIISFSFHLLKF